MKYWPIFLVLVLVTHMKQSTVYESITVNHRITPRGLIYQQRNFWWGLIRAGGLFERGAY